MMSEREETASADWLAKGTALRKARVARGESLADAARRMGLTPRLLGDIEHGRVNPMAMLFPEIANARH